MEKLKIDDILPKTPVFFLSKFPGHEFQVRPPNMADHAWFIENFETLEGAQKIIADRRWGEICRIVYYLFNDQDRRKFPAEVVKEMNESGEEITKTYLGWQILLRSLSGIEEATGVLAALTRAIMASNPIIDQAVRDQLKKNLKALGRK